VIAAAAGEQGATPQRQRAQASHDASPFADRNRARISVVVSHSPVSLATCLRPARVSV
jgi:hypothetical protein